MSDEAARERGPARRLTTILAADLAGYSALSETDPDGALAAVADLTAVIDRAASEAGGRLFHRAGDGFLCELPSATNGVRVARAIQRAGGPAVRIGVHTGEVTEEASGDLLGHAVNVAARLQAEARPGGIVVSAATRTLSEANVPLRKVGDLKLRNMKVPVTAYEVAADGWRARLGALGRTAWVRRNRAALAAGLGAVLIGALGVTGLALNEAVTARAEQRAAERDARLRAEAAALADELTASETRLLEREAVERAALGVVASTDEDRAAARAAARAGDLHGAALALRAAYEAKPPDAPQAELAALAVQCGAFAYGRDQALAQWAYERAYEVMPREPLVLLRLAEVAQDRGRDEDARSYYIALLATEPEPAYLVRGELGLSRIASRMRRFDEAERRLERALATARAGDLRRMEAEVLADLGALLMLRFQPEGDAGVLARQAEAARGHLRRSLRVFRALQDVEGTTDVLSLLAFLELRLNNQAEAIQAYGEVLDLAQATGETRRAASAAFNLTMLHRTSGNRTARDAYWQQAFDAAQAASLDSLVGQLHVARAAYAHDDGDVEDACAHLGLSAAYHDASDPNVQAMREGMIPGLSCP